MLDGVLLPHLDARAIAQAYGSAPGNELDSGKIASPESSAALVANGFGYYLDAPGLLPPLPGVAAAWPPHSVTLEGIARGPWSGGRHPCRDVLLDIPDAIVGIESKRYEPFRAKGAMKLSDAYWRPVWGERMRGFERVRDDLRDGSLRFDHLDAAQLVKHAFGLRTAAARLGKRATLLYLHCEPTAWPDGHVVPAGAHERHSREIAAFAAAVADDEVAFAHLTWRALLGTWAASDDDGLRRHVAAVLDRFGV